MRLVAQVEVALIVTALKSDSAFTEENAVDLHLLCAAFRLGGVDMQLPEMKELKQADIDEIRTMNKSTAEASWQELFKGDPNKDTCQARKSATNKEPFLTHWEQSFPQWQQDYQRAIATGNGKTWLAEHKVPSNEWHRQLAAHTINETLEHILSPRKSYDKIKSDITETKAKQVKALICEALYGDGQTDCTPKATVTTTTDTTWTTSCGTNGGKSIVGDMLCLCCASSGGNTADCDNSNIACDWTSSNIGKFATVTAKCPNQKPTKITPQLLATTIAQLKSRIKHKDQGSAIKFHLGKDPSSCTGTTGSLCVTYTTATTPGATGGGLDAIPWLKKLNDAQGKVDEIVASAAEAQSTAMLIQLLISSAKTTYSAPAVNIQTSREDITGVVPAIPNPRQASTTNETCKLKGTGDDCKDGCKEITENGEKKCIVDAEAAKQPAQSRTGGNGETATDKCGLAKNPEECAAVKRDIPKDKKAVCG
uniref:Variant surface glycoprotein 1113 n=1 Tax=Trypanosoma brucei TaxID=5691 RepID=M4SUM2_9TRYP|nr:variant surface glycoprotein 1113 [Trypanosoma brucei]